MTEKKLKPWQKHLDEWLIMKLNARRPGLGLTKVDCGLFARDFHQEFGSKYGITTRQVELFVYKCVDC